MYLLCERLSTAPRMIRIGRSLAQNVFGKRSLSTAESPILVNEDSKTGVAVVTMAHKPVNLMNTTFLEELHKTIVNLEENKCRGMILTSSSDNVFSAGLDLSEMYQAPRDKMSLFWTTLQKAWLTLYSTSIPTAAVINGHSPAGGCILALSCEYRVMVGPKFTIGLNETQLGLVAPPWFFICMKDAIGPRQTEVALTAGKLFTAPEALEIGLIDKMVADKAEAMEDAHKFLAQFAKIPPLARKMSKEMVRKEGIQYMEEKVIEDLENFIDMASSEAAQKTLGMYLAKLKKK